MQSDFKTQAAELTRYKALEKQLRKVVRIFLRMEGCLYMLSVYPCVI